MITKQKYDIIIVGAGAAGLTLACKIAQTPSLHDKSVLLIDKVKKQGNDRTWCFWESGVGDYDDILTKSWSNIYFHSNSLSRRLGIEPFAYKMLRSDNFYGKSFSIIKNSPNIEFIVGDVEEIDKESGNVICKKHLFTSDIIFTSKLPKEINFSKHLYTDQHFGGWFIEFEEEVFDSEAATFMDFRIDQNDEHRFCYVLPISSTKALVEVAIFSNNHQSKNGYDNILECYIEKYISVLKYTILEREYGVIPMTNYPFWKHNTDNIFHIGTAGGAVKPSSGFAFNRIQRHSQLIVECLVNNIRIDQSYKMFKGRHLLYDSIMLHVLEVQKIPGQKVFSDLFEKTEVNVILKFLDGNTSLSGDLQIIKAPIKWPFIKGMAKVLSSF